MRLLFLRGCVLDWQIRRKPRATETRGFQRNHPDKELLNATITDYRKQAVMSIPILTPPAGGPKLPFVTQQGLARYPVVKDQFIKFGPKPDAWYQSAVSDRWFPLWRETTILAYVKAQVSK